MTRCSAGLRETLHEIMRRSPASTKRQRSQVQSLIVSGSVILITYRGSSNNIEMSDRRR